MASALCSVTSSMIPLSYLIGTLWAIGLSPGKFLGVLFPESKVGMISGQSILGSQAEKVSGPLALAFRVETLASELGAPRGSRRP